MNDRALVDVVVADSAMWPVGDRPSAGGIVIQHAVERRDAAVVHVGRGQRNVAQSRRPELADVGRLPGHVVQSRVLSGIRQWSGQVVEPGIVEFGTSGLATSFEIGGAGEGEAVV